MRAETLAKAAAAALGAAALALVAGCLAEGLSFTLERGAVGRTSGGAATPD